MGKLILSSTCGYDFNAGHFLFFRKKERTFQTALEIPSQVKSWLEFPGSSNSRADREYYSVNVCAINLCYACGFMAT